jgi:signal transduction histidine kinase/ligand-binding sensor domain-containing protein
MMVRAAYNSTPFCMNERSAISLRALAFGLHSSPASPAPAGANVRRREWTSRRQYSRILTTRTVFRFNLRQILTFWLWSTVLVLLGASALFAQQHTLEVSQYRHTSWTSQEGFFRAGISAINSVAQTSDGYLWVAGTGAVFRFDGVRFSEWKPPANDSLPRRPLHRLLASKDGSLWIAGIGLAELKANGEFRKYHELDGVEIESGLIEDRDGGIWAGGAGPPQSSKLCRFYHGASECFPADSPLGPKVGALHEDRRGQLWASTTNGIWRLRPGPPEKYAEISGRDSALGFEEDASGTLVFSGGDDLQMVTADGKVIQYPIEPIRARALLKDREGDLWIGTTGQGIIHVHEGRTDRFTAMDGLSSNSIIQIFQDREGNLWAGTSRGLDKFTRPAVPNITSKQGLLVDYVNSVLRDREGVLWVATRSGLYRLVEGRWIKSRVKLPGDMITSVFETSKGRVLVATDAEKGIMRFDGDKVSHFGAVDGDVFGLVEDSRGDLWVASHALGLLHFGGDGKLIESFDKKMLGKLNIAVAFDPKRDGLWLASNLGEIGFFKDGRVVERYGAKDGLAEGIIRDLQVDNDGGVWAGTRSGLAHLKSGKISVMSRKNGLPCDAVHWMRRDKDHNVWLYTECGLVAFPEGDLSSWLADPSHTVVIVHYLDNTDGVESVAYNGWYTPQTTTTSDGRILFATTSGLSVLDPGNLNQNSLPPPVHIEGITADEREVKGSGRVSLPAKVRNVRIDFTALSFTAPWKVRFRYKLMGYDTDWSSPVSFRQATYTNLPPGNYEFQVVASNNDGVWNRTGDTLSFVIPPAFYQALWFKVLMAITIAASVWILYLLRLKQATANVQERLLAQMEERERIARELHDTLLQGFQGITLRMQGVVKNMPNHDPIRKMIDDVLDRGDEVLREARHRVRDLRRRTSDENDLSDRLTKCGQELSKDHAANFTLAIVGGPRILDSSVQDEAFRIVAEALANAFRHASASKIEAEVTYDASALRIRVRDDGVGIDKAVLSNGKPGHWGLRGIRERARALRAELNIWSREAAGTEVELVIPASIAYPREQTIAT